MRIIGFVMASLCLFSGCGGFPFVTKKNKRKPKAELSMQSSYQLEQKNLKFFKNESCKTDPSSGLSKLTFTNGTNKLAIELRGDLRPTIFKCKQAENNATSTEHIGDGYENCAVAVTVESANRYGRENQFERYEIFRSSTDIGLFEYNKTCRVQVDDVGDRVSGNILCEDMAMTYYGGYTRNPVSIDGRNPEDTASFNGKFSCDLERGLLKSDYPSDPPPPEYLAEATIDWSDDYGQKSQDLKFNLVKECSFNPITGLLDIRIENGVDDVLEVAVRDFAREPGEFACEQAANNTDEVDSVGDLYDNCKVGMSFDSKYAGDGVVAFAMHRPDTEYKLFNYADSCVVRVDSVEDDLVEGSATCAQLAQIEWNGIARNPVAQDDINADVAGDMVASFSCRIDTLGETE